jgi:hypothetical protein
VLSPKGPALTSTILGQLALAVLDHLAVAALDVLEEACECPPVILILLPWLVGGKEVLVGAPSPPLPPPGPPVPGTAVRPPPSPPSLLPHCDGEPTRGQLPALSATLQPPPSSRRP